MAQFVDAANRPWQVNLDVGRVKRVRDELHLDLLSEESVKRLADDIVLFVDVLGVVCEEEIAKLPGAAEDHSVGVREFVKQLRDGTLDRAVDAFIESISDFFGVRGRVIAAAYRKQKATMNAAGIHAETKIQAMDLETPVKAKIDTAIEKALSNFGN